MSWRHARAIIDLKIGKPPVCALLLALAHHADQYSGVCWPSLERLCDATGYSRRTVQTAIADAVRMGLITWKKGGNRRASVYTLTLPEILPISQQTGGVHSAADALHSASVASHSAAAAPQLPKNDQGNSHSERVTPSDILEGWNEIAQAHGLSVAIAMKDARLAAAKARIRDYPDADTWRLAFKNLAGSPFLLGQGRNGWKADIDFFLRPSSFIKLLEGSYGQAN